MFSVKYHQVIDIRICRINQEKRWKNYKRKAELRSDG